MQAEGSPCSYNPLDTEWLMTDDDQGTPCNSAGVQDYSSEQEGLTATCNCLNNGATGYDSIMAGLSSSADPTTTGTAIANSVWGTGQLALECIEDAMQGSYAGWASEDIAT